MYVSYVYMHNCILCYGIYLHNVLLGHVTHEITQVIILCSPMLYCANSFLLHNLVVVATSLAYQL